MQEGYFLYNHNVSPYDGGVYHQAPLLLPLFSLFTNTPIDSYLLLYSIADLLSAVALFQIAESREAGSSALFKSPRSESRWSGHIVATV